MDPGNEVRISTLRRGAMFVLMLNNLSFKNKVITFPLMIVLEGGSSGKSTDTPDTTYLSG